MQVSNFFPLNIWFVFDAFGVLGGPCGRLLDCVWALEASWAITRGPKGTSEHPREPPGVPFGCCGGSSGPPWAVPWTLLRTFGESLGCSRAALARSRQTCDSRKFTKRYASAGFSVCLQLKEKLTFGFSWGITRCPAGTSEHPKGSHGVPLGAAADLLGIPGKPFGAPGSTQGVLGAALDRSQRPCDLSTLTKRYACAGFSVFV